MKTLIGGLIVAIGLLAGVALAQSPQEKVVSGVRAKYPAIVTEEQLGAMTVESAVAVNAAGIPGGPYGLLKKAVGRNCQGFSCDVICSGQPPTQTQIDLWISGGNGVARPAWQVINRAKQRNDVCVAIGAPAPDPTPDPPECPAPEPCPTCPTCPPDRSADVARLEAQLAEAKARIPDHLWTRIVERAKRDGVSTEEVIERGLREPRCETANAFWRSLGIGCRVIP